jgi:hypothetical protein
MLVFHVITGIITNSRLSQSSLHVVHVGNFFLQAELSYTVAVILRMAKISVLHHMQNIADVHF